MRIHSTQSIIRWTISNAVKKMQNIVITTSKQQIYSLNHYIKNGSVGRDMRVIGKGSQKRKKDQKKGALCSLCTASDFHNIVAIEVTEIGIQARYSAL